MVQHSSIPPSAPRTVAVLGAGPMGLAVSYELLKQGYSVDLYERDDRIGGMSASTMLDGLKIERYYHFICAPDKSLFQYLQEFGIQQKLRWKETKMGFYFQGRLYDWGNPIALLRFPGLDLLSKLRYGLHVLYAKGIHDWKALDSVPCTDWLKRWVGNRAYDVLWRSLFEQKFYEYKDSLSAAWLGTRIQRVALSRKSMFVELLGYLEGGSDTLLEAIDESIRKLGGRIFLNTRIDEILVDTQAKTVVGVRTEGKTHAYDNVVSTIPLPYLVRLAPALPASEREKIAAIINIGVVCAVFKLRHSISSNFWTNINDPDIQIPGIIEYTNLNKMPCTVVYAPFYMPTSNPKYRRPVPEFIDEVKTYLARLNPNFKDDWVIAANAFRYEFAQTVCTPGFYDKLPPMRSTVAGLYMADTSHYYPEDRSISESMRLGKLLASMLVDDDKRDGSSG
jgi:protoporphyrinogen oxidase